jgi:hypothetical protein
MLQSISQPSRSTREGQPLIAHPTSQLVRSLSPPREEEPPARQAPGACSATACAQGRRVTLHDRDPAPPSNRPASVTSHRSRVVYVGRLLHHRLRTRPPRHTPRPRPCAVVEPSGIRDPAPQPSRLRPCSATGDPAPPCGCAASRSPVPCSSCIEHSSSDHPVPSSCLVGSRRPSSLAVASC